MSDNAHEALARALEEHITSEGIRDKPWAMDFVQSARSGRYCDQNPVSPEYINMTSEQFTTLRALVYRPTNPKR